MESFLSDKQRKTVAAAATVISVAIILGAVIGLFWIVVRFFAVFDHVFLPLAVAGVLALVIQPYYDWLRSKARLPTALALLLLFASLVLPILGMLYLFGSLIAHQMAELIDEIPTLWDRVTAYLEERRPELQELFKKHPVGETTRESLQSSVGPLMKFLGNAIAGIFTAGASLVSGAVSLFGWAVMPVYLAFFLLMPNLQPGSTAQALPFLKPETRKDAVFLVKEFINLVVVFFRGQLLIALIQGILFAIGFSLVGLKYGAAIGLILGFLNIIPYLGSMIGLGVALPLAYFQADGGAMVLMLVLIVFAIVQVIEGYLLTPKIMGDRTGLHPMVIIVAIFFWGSALDGILGMILAIPLTAFLVVFWRLAREKYIFEIV
ncbi:MAG: AI-2E family transporter [Arenicellales bacterium]|nr:AI-2E family transporter [Arenicellales bacterium]